MQELNDPFLCASSAPPRLRSRLLQVFTLIALLSAPSLQAQILEHPKGLYFGEEPFFNEDFIARNGIAEIRAPISKKREMDRIRITGTENYYEFDEEGKLKRQFEVFVHKDTLSDTSFIDYEYDKGGRVTKIRRNDLHGFYEYDYEYDEKGRLVEERYSRIENEGSSRYEFEPGRRYIIDEESYEYREPNDTMLIREYFNSEDRVYRKKFYYTDSLGYLQREHSRYIITNQVSETRYKYDEKGRVTERREITDVADSTTERYEYQYDSLGNLLERNFYQNEKQMLHEEYLYQDSTMLLDAEIEKDEETLLITITRFKYRFRDEDAKGREEEGVSSEQ